MENEPIFSPPAQKSSPPTLWIVLGAGVVACLCLVGAAVLFGMYFASTQVGDEFPQIIEQLQEPGVETGGELDEEADSELDDSVLAGQVIEVPIQGFNHVEPGEPHEPYNSDPPTSGPHYAEWVDAGFYDTPVDDGYLVHNLEHGHVIIWYDCGQLSPDECDQLKNDIMTVIEDFDTFKVIGMPREGMETVLALTTWGRLARLDEFDREFIVAFIETYRNQAPEPNAP